MPEVVIGSSEVVEQPNLDVVVAETEQAIITAAQDEGEVQDAGPEFQPTEAEPFQQIPIDETPDEAIPETVDLDPPNDPPLPPVLQGFPEGEDDGAPGEGGSEQDHVTEITEATEPSSNEPAENNEVAAGDAEGPHDDIVPAPENTTDAVDDAAETVGESDVRTIREIDVSTELGHLDEASTLVTEQLLEDPFVKEDVTDVMLGEDWHNLCVFGDEGQVVGVATVTTVETPNEEPYAFLAYFVIDAAYRGRDLGRQLLGEVERFASAAGATSLLLEAFPDPRVTDESQRRDPSTFFEHHGYEAYNEEDPVQRRKSL